MTAPTPPPPGPRLPNPGTYEERPPRQPRGPNPGVPERAPRRPRMTRRRRQQEIEHLLLHNLAVSSRAWRRSLDYFHSEHGCSMEAAA